MIVLDANILIYTYNADMPQHAQVRQWFEMLLAGPDRVGLSWVTLWAFLRVSTNPRAIRTPLAPAEAFDTIRELARQPRVVQVEPGPRHTEILEQLVLEGQAWGPLMTDAALAAIAMEHGAALASTDRDFSRFPGLRWVNPLASA